MDGKPGKAYSSIGAMVFDEHGKRLAYVAHENKQIMVVVDGQEGSRYPDDQQIFEIKFDSQGRKVAYIHGSWQDGMQATVEGVEGKKYYAIQNLHFTPTGQLAYWAAPDLGTWIWVEGESEGKVVKTSEAPVFDPASGSIAYVVNEKDRGAVSFNGQMSKWYESIMSKSPSISPDGKQVAFIALLRSPLGKIEQEDAVVVNGVEQKHYGLIESEPIWSANGRTLAYLAYQKWPEPKYLVLNGKETPLTDIPSPFGSGSFILSPDGQHAAWSASVRSEENKGPKYCVLVDGKKVGRSYDFIYQPAFSPDSKWIGYGVREGSELWWIAEKLSL